MRVDESINTRDTPPHSANMLKRKMTSSAVLQDVVRDRPAQEHTMAPEDAHLLLAELLPMQHLRQLVGLHDPRLAQRVQHALEEGVVGRLVHERVRHLQVVDALKRDAVQMIKRVLLVGHINTQPKASLLS